MINLLEINLQRIYVLISAKFMPDKQEQPQMMMYPPMQQMPPQQMQPPAGAPAASNPAPAASSQH